MKLKILILLLILSSAGLAWSQTGVISDVPSHSFTGVKTQDGRLFYTTYDGIATKEVTYSIIVEIYGPDLTRLNKVTVPSKWGGEIVSVTEHKGGLLFYFKFGKEASLWGFDKDGQKTFDKAFTMEKPYMNTVTLKSLGSNGILMVRPDKLEKIDGMRIEGFDDQMNSKWIQTYFPPKGNITDKKVLVNGDKIGILSTFWISSMSKVYEEEVLVLQASDGKLVYRKHVANNENFIKMEQLFLESDGSTFIAGHVVPGTDAIPTGLAVTAFGSDGTQKFTQTHLFAAPLTAQLTPKPVLTVFDIGKAPFINIESVNKSDKGYTIIGETYQYVKATDKEYAKIPGALPSTPEQNSSGSAPGQFFVMDYVVINVDNSGALTINRIGKPYKKIQGQSIMSIEKPTHAKQFFQNRNFFSYRVTADNGKPVIVSMGWNQNMHYIGFTPITAKREDILSRIYLGRNVINKSQAENGEYTTFLYHESGEVKPANLFMADVLPFHEKGKVLYYSYENSKLTLKVIEIPKI